MKRTDVQHPEGLGALRLTLQLGCAQTLAWASSYYLPAIVAKPAAAELGLRTETFLVAFSLALGVSAVAGPFAGRAIDKYGGRGVLFASNLAFAVGLFTMATSQGTVQLFAAWILMGLAMGSGLYEAAFATVVGLRGAQAKPIITGITLIAGFASTVGWPLSTLCISHLGWRGTCLVWMSLHLVIGTVLNLTIPHPPSVAGQSSIARKYPVSDDLMLSDKGHKRSLILLSAAFAATWFVSTAMAVHLPSLLAATGLAAGTAVAAGSLVGPFQIVGRVAESTVFRRWHPLITGRLAAVMHPLAVLLLFWGGSTLAVPFAALHGIGNGVLTVAQGTLPLVLFGPQSYGRRQGLLMAPARFAQAAAPVAFGVCFERWGQQALWLSFALATCCFLALMFVHDNSQERGRRG